MMGMVLAVAAALRLYDLDRRSLWIDEIYSAQTALSPIRQLARYVRASEAAVPLDYLGLKVSLLVAGTSTTGARAWAVVLGVIACALMYAAGRLWFGSRFVGLSAAFLLAIAPFHIYYSQEARPYSLLVVATLLNLCAFQLAVRHRGVLSWAVYSLAITVGLYAFYFSGPRPVKWCMRIRRHPRLVAGHDASASVGVPVSTVVVSRALVSDSWLM